MVFASHCGSTDTVSNDDDDAENQAFAFVIALFSVPECVVGREHARVCVGVAAQNEIERDEKLGLGKRSVCVRSLALILCDTEASRSMT